MSLLMQTDNCCKTTSSTLLSLVGLKSLLELVQGKVTEMIKVLENMTYKKRLKTWFVETSEKVSTVIRQGGYREDRTRLLRDAQGYNERQQRKFLLDATESQNGWSWKAPLEVLLSKDPAQEGYQELVAQDHIKTGFEYLQGWKHHSLSRQPVPVLNHHRINMREKHCLPQGG